jgi:Asp-tRNA(Asn)/Glu-tRNA(Gln) amidotransferase A subunit family amidase
MRKAFLFFLFLVTGCGTPNQVSRRDIQGAQKLIGVEFTPKEQETMLDYLRDNRRGYDSMRAELLPNDVAPALIFDPRPDHFKLKVRDKSSAWNLPDGVELPQKDEEIAFLSVAKLGALLKAGKISSTRLTKIYLDRLRKYDTLRAVVTITETLALQQAAAADAELAEGQYRGPLHGVPYGIKDLFAVPGYPTTWGAEPYEKQVIQETAAVVKKLEEAGAVLVAKLTSGALARGDIWFGGQTKNPWDLKQGASGSSAGSASATAAGLVAFSIGTETLGSILAPSARCGATGLRPTYGAVSRAGAMTLSWTMDKAGPICRTAQDCALVFEVIRGTGEKEKDRTVVNYPFAFHPPRDLKGFKVGYFKKLFDIDTTRTKSPNEAMLEAMKAMGAELHAIDLPDSVSFDSFDIILRAEAGAFFDVLVREHRDRLMSEQDGGSRANSLRQSRFITAVEYLQANRHRKLLIEKFNRILAPYDVVVGPENSFRLSLMTNLTGHPAMAIPSGLDKRGRPTSFMLISNLYDEGPLLETAYLLQQATEYEEKHPPLFQK